ncbi:hypothetical protein BROUX41_006200 [Berkeleyomyces rouxiae]|uniref:uncharacterized protein n=1 Tax=Berkeleyomyces rouxiae TaxID=2035830 RepID=UPI003B7A4494
MSDTEDVVGLFQDPEDYYPPTPPPTMETYDLDSGETINLHLVGHSPLEAHHLWNGSRIVSKLFEKDPALVRDKTVFELGAGAGLPSLVAGVLGARRVVVTDFPDVDLVKNMQKNIDECDAMAGRGSGRIARAVAARGFVWGADVGPIMAAAAGMDVEKDAETTTTITTAETAAATGATSDTPATTALPLPGPHERFDVLVLADLLFRHSEHAMMVKTIREALRKTRDARTYVVFTSYRPWLRHKDLAFFDLCRADGFVVEQILEQKLDKPLFANDPGDVEVQKTVTGWLVMWPETAWTADGQ